MKDLREVQINGNTFREMRQKDIKILREKIWESNNRKCPVLGVEIPLKDTALDHCHKKVSEDYSPSKGTIRTTLDFRVNSVLGKLENSIIRYGLHNFEGFDLPEFLRNAAEYFEEGAYRDSDGNYYIHPREVPKEPQVSKRNYNKLAKLYKESDKKAKFPEYPKSKKLTAQLKKLFEEFNIEPYN